MAHLVSFTILMILATLSQWPVPWWGIAVLFCCYGAATEFFQGLTPTRQPEFQDFFQDCGGIVIGLGLSWIIMFLWRFFHKPIQSVKVQESSQ
jgi:VanZ family protein